MTIKQAKLGGIMKKTEENSSQKSRKSLKQLSNDESRTENNTINHHSVWRAFRIRCNAFIIGVLVGICIILIKPWNYIHALSFLNQKQNNEMSVSSRSDDTIEIKDNKDSTKASVSISYLKESIKSASDLITTKYFYKDANTYKNTKTFFDHKVPFTTDETVYTYEGTVSLGIDISQISFSVDNTAKTIMVSMPDVKIIANEIDEDSFQFITAKDSIFNNTDMQDYTKLLGELKKKKSEEVMKRKDLIEATKQKSQTVIANLIKHTELASDYTVTFE